MRALDFLLYPVAWLSTWECEVMDIKQRLTRISTGVPVCETDMMQLCRDALAEIESLEQSHGKRNSEARQVEALERIATALEYLTENGIETHG